MAVTITSNKKNTSAVIHVSAANASIIIAGNNSVSNVAIQDEVLTGAYITQIFWGNGGTGQAKILRNSVLVGAFDSSGYYDYAGSGMPMSVEQTANIDIQFTDANQYIFFEIQKVGNLTSNSEYFTT